MVCSKEATVGWLAYQAISNEVKSGLWKQYNGIVHSFFSGHKSYPSQIDQDPGRCF